MTKRILIFIGVMTALFGLSYGIHSFILNAQEASVSYSLLGVYIFHLIAAMFLYGIVELVAKFLPDQAAYAYLGSIFIKIGFFVLIFKASVFSNVELPMPERLSLIVPLFLFLFAEAIFIAKLLNNK
ncbi:conserved membrane hypothetical protein [Tenacibaculum litopenaei]|uniref:DUF6168 family protein n=1 Tax=Tenacibaculum litopenaei TaxID=396016 RepID=UPI00389432AC